MSRNHGSKHTDPTSRLVESTAIVHRRWLLCVGIMLGISIGVGVTHVMPYTWWSYAVIATGIAAVLVNRPDFRSVLQARMEHDEQEVFAGDA